ncbi:hypothetical protein [Circoviridae sp.]|nr:hypothetical protein [Circoviridae sp.]
MLTVHVEVGSTSGAVSSVPTHVSMKVRSPVAVTLVSNMIPSSTQSLHEEITQSFLGESTGVGIGEEDILGIEAEAVGHVRGGGFNITPPPASASLLD